jgi:hypothetical protein
MIAQLACYALAVFSDKIKQQNVVKKLANLCRYFALINLASAHAFYKFLCRKKQVLWNPRTG